MAHFLKRFYPWQSLKLLSKALLSPTKTQTITTTKPLIALSPEKAINAVEDTLTAIHLKQMKFSVQIKTSCIPNAGLGVFLKGTTQPRGTIVGFYPGTIYLPAEPVLFVSLSNQYILKCVDGLYVDGKPSGLSGRVYQSLYKRENWPGAIQISDMTWMDRKILSNPLAIGQYVNNGTSIYPANVCYQEVDLPIAFPNDLRYLIPNMYWNPDFQLITRLVALVSLDDIHPGEELRSTYMDVL
ncbi:hypothetical protein EDC96DRAFT_571827 [Choanephora cucurbitarum]|nr:hypothetical protein EDC96DRAFT_571827 [Choanephora cucurbitarum]